MTHFSINGRFLTQKVTGVQRYAAEITGQLDQLVAANPALSVRLLTPSGTTVPPFKSLTRVDVPSGGGVAWEQTRLPFRGEGALLCLGNTCPILYRRSIVCIHDANFRQQPESYSKPFRLYMNTMLALMSRSAARVTSVSSHSARLLQSYGVSRDREIVVAPNGHEHALRWDPQKATVPGTLDATRPFVLLVGSLAQHKNWAVIAKVASELAAHGIDIVAVGAGGREFGAVEGEQFRHFNLLGRISDDDLSWLYRNALCLLFPSLIEGFGLPLVEAMALGCPIVSSNSSVMPEIGSDAVLYADPTDPSAWLQATLALQAQAELRQDLARRGAAQVTKFSWKKSAEKYIDLAAAVSSGK